MPNPYETIRKIRNQDRAREVDLANQARQRDIRLLIEGGLAVAAVGVIFLATVFPKQTEAVLRYFGIIN